MIKNDVNGIYDFYTWSRDYWIELSRSSEGKDSYALNFGLWKSQTLNLYEAQENFRQTILSLLGELPTDAVGLEIGCGIGGFAAKLAAEKHVHLTCIDLLKDHLALAENLAQTMNVDSLIDFRQESSMSLSFKEEVFDFAYCIESSFHYPDKQKFLNEVYRILKTNGTFILADITCENNSLVTFRKGNYFPGHNELIENVEKSGFHIKKDISIGEHVFEPLYKYVRNYNAGRKNKLTKYWEIVLANYARLYQKERMDYEIFQLVKTF